MAADLAGALARAEVSSAAMRICRTSALRPPDRRLAFSINDFDETLPAPFEWDVKRLLASFAVAGRDRGFDNKQRKSINLMITRAYREAIRSSPGCPTSISGTHASTSTRSSAGG